MVEQAQVDEAATSLLYTTKDAPHNRHCHVLTLEPVHQRQETKSDTHAVKYTTCLAHYTNMPHVTTHQLATHGSRQG